MRSERFSLEEVSINQKKEKSNTPAGLLEIHTGEESSLVKEEIFDNSTYA